MRSSIVIAVCGLMLVACNDGDGSADGSTDVDAGTESGEVTYYGDIRPILSEACESCHTDGGIAPFAFQTYELARELGPNIAEATESRIMPPFLADNSGDCNTWSNFRGLTDDEIALIGEWVDTGMAEGDPTTPAPMPSELPTLPRTDVALVMPNEYTIDGSSSDDYRCFVVDTGLTEAAFAVAYEVEPGNVQRVHHVITYNPFNDAEAQEARDLDMEDGVEGDGYPCFGGPRVGAPPMTLWAPGTGTVELPRGTGIEMAANRPMIVQIHYNNLVPDSANTDRTTVNIMTRASAIPGYFLPVADGDLNIPPRMEMHEETARQNLDWIFAQVPVASLNMYGVAPHMHTLGRSMQVQVNRPTLNECLIDVPSWDFNWQLAYWLDDPIPFTAEDAASITCRFNSMSRDEVTTWGDGTLDEMCLAFVYVSL